MGEPFTLAWVELLAIILGPTGAAWVGVRAGLNGQRARLERVENALSRIEDKVGQDHDQLVRLERDHMGVVRDIKQIREYGCRQLQNHLQVLRQFDDDED